MLLTKDPAVSGSATTALAPEPNEQAEEASAAFDIGQLQELGPAALQDLFAQFDFRPHPGHNRHQQILAIR